MENITKTLSVKLFGVLAILACMLSQDCIASDYIALDNGYRWDKITNRATLGGPTISVKGSTQILKRINSYQLGARGEWTFWDCAFVRGSGHYGWVLSGDYSEGGYFGNTRGNTYDAQGSLGYYIGLTPSIWAAPVVGWSYDALNLKGEDITTAINGFEYDLSDIKSHQRFNGPFVGFDFIYEVNDCFDFTFGYEFHFARWHGERLIEGEEYGNPIFGYTTGYSNTRHINRVYGNVFNLDGSYQFCDCWLLGLRLKYQYFTGDFGKYKRTETPLLPFFTYANVDGLWWRSFSSTIYVGRMF